MDRCIFIFLILVLAAIYILSPVDLVPDAVLVIGWVDDAAVALALGTASRK